MKWMLGRQGERRVPFPDQSFLLSEGSPEVASLLSLERKREREPKGAEPRTKPPAARSLPKEEASGAVRGYQQPARGWGSAAASWEDKS